MKLEEYLAKDVNEGSSTLLEHSKYVSKVAVLVAKMTLSNPDSDLIKAVEIAGLLHDVGKMTDYFQNFTRGKDTPKKYKLPYLHQEIGWAFLELNLDLGDCKLKELVLDAIYWHHNLPHQRKLGFNYSNVIMESVKPQENKNMVLFTKHVLDNQEVINEREWSDTQTPYFYNPKFDDTHDPKVTDYRKQFVRYCLMIADRNVSAITNKDDLPTVDFNRMFNNMLLRKSVVDVPQTLYGNSDRWKEQKSLVEDVTSNTALVKAPAGFGKTLVGLLWNFKRDRKLLWVCPRNSVAATVYLSILEELKVMNINMKVELFFTNEYQDSNYLEPSKFKSEIIVTNIDNYLAANIDTNKTDGLFYINNFDVVFDEYHELVDQGAYFSLFLNNMKTRHRLTNARTLLLSATPIPLEHIWDAKDMYTQILPKNGHCTPAHQNKYDISIVTELPERKLDTVHFFNSVKGAQKFAIERNRDWIMHSKFLTPKRDIDFEKVHLIYGKNGINMEHLKVNLVATPVLQASFDVSFSHGNESVKSPEDTLQRIGRVDRWGNASERSFTIIKSKDKSEQTTIGKQYNKGLSDMWFEELEKLNGGKFTLSEIYDVYNNFTNTNLKAIKFYIRARIKESTDHLSEIFPKKNGLSLDDEKNYIAGGNRLRRTKNKEIYFICKKLDGTGYTDVFSTQIYVSLDVDFKRGDKGNLLILMKRRIKSLMNDSRFGFKDMINGKGKYWDKLTIAEIESKARFMKTPYIRTDVFYHNEYGIIDEKMKNDLNL